MTHDLLAGCENALVIIASWDLEKFDHIGDWRTRNARHPVDFGEMSDECTWQLEMHVALAVALPGDACSTSAPQGIIRAQGSQGRGPRAANGRRLGRCGRDCFTFGSCHIRYRTLAEDDEGVGVSGPLNVCAYATS